MLLLKIVKPFYCPRFKPTFQYSPSISSFALSQAPTISLTTLPYWDILCIFLVFNSDVSKYPYSVLIYYYLISYLFIVISQNFISYKQISEASLSMTFTILNSLNFRIVNARLFYSKRSFLRIRKIPNSNVFNLEVWVVSGSFLAKTNIIIHYKKYK